jgi:hypothetical protein
MDRRAIEEEREQMQQECKDELSKELEKLKEILSQEFEYRKMQLE